MADTLFKKVEYQLSTLVDDIERGRIGLPEIQRGYVWKSGKVRDLFDSIYKGYPVGYLMLWEHGADEGSRNIGTDSKQEVPSRMVVDGQQRLTSLYAVIKGKEITRNDRKAERIQIAFNPIEELFAVLDAAVERDCCYVPDISKIWDDNIGFFSVYEDYKKRLDSSGRNVSDVEGKRIQQAFDKLSKITTYPFSALELNADITDEAVHEVFVRINNAGEPLSQADFLMTRISVFWNDGRTELERFCEASRTPAIDDQSPFNHYFEPTADQLLRVCFALAFKRVRLESINTIVGGKSLETGKHSREAREQQFGLLKEAQQKVLDLVNWHEFMRCLHSAGFRSKRMISSGYSLLSAYTLFLIGKTEFAVEENRLRRIISRWFFMSALTGRYTSSWDSSLQSDLRIFRDAKSADDFVRQLGSECDQALTSNFWDHTLPNNLATHSPNSSARFTYEAALVILNAPVLFSESRVSDFIDPTLQSNNSREIRHQLFPQVYLAKLGIRDDQKYNQIANFAYEEWGENVRHDEDSPIHYVQRLKQGFSKSALSEMYHYHALPENWEDLEYDVFLESRRKLMAQVIKEGYFRLSGLQPAGEAAVVEEDLESLIGKGESDQVEFKSTLRMNLHTSKVDQQMENAVLKTLTAFLNADGGTLIIGVADDGTPIGIEADKFQNEDHMNRHLFNLINDRMGPLTSSWVHTNFDDHEGSRVMKVRCNRSSSPVYLKDRNKESFYVRSGPSTFELTTKQAVEYMTSWFDK